ncbi:DUF742 domain-containing protein [Frankia sp. AgB32]|uniref:DUF742 domain-containing protein n=1 Tax=Frankia sp. AgB32 TaxID=631119 RepID=UPI00200E9B5B|nr:DUF742 domain-containing protein [Frankia sp. AgB32]MCK9897933.1 DUF742 domain-containing protein [Frankia sp. AgB32]
MIRESIDRESPDRLYTVTAGRSRSERLPFDLVTLIVSESEPNAGMQSELAAILRICRTPTAVVELAAELRLPVSVVMILLGDLHGTGRVSARAPSRAAGPAHLPHPEILRQVLGGLRKL